MVINNYLPNKIFSPLLLFVLTLFFVFVADSSLSYIFPIIIVESFDSNLLMGLILGFSSIVGLICDFLFPIVFKGRGWKFYLTSAIFLTFLFPIFLSIGSNFHSVIFFLLASAIWGIYFEFLIFSLQKFIVSTQHKEDFSKNWGFVYSFTGTAKILGPILGLMFIHISLSNAPLFLIIVQLISVVFLFVTLTSVRSEKFHSSYKNENVFQTLDLKKEIKYWEVLFPSILPAFIAGLLIIGIDALFWTLGGLLGDEIFVGQTNIEWLVILAYVVPSIFGSILISRINIKNQKKKLSQLFLIFAGFMLFLLIFPLNKFVLILIISLVGLGTAAAASFNDAVFSDLIKRLGKNDIHLIALSRLTASISYILIPIIAGALSDSVAYLSTFSIIGFFVMSLGIFLYFVTPKKLKIHEKQIHEIDLQ